MPRRDSVDAKIVDEVRRGKGSIIDTQQQVGGWPELKQATPPADSDNDGMPDAWERRHGLNPTDPSDGSADKDKDGYTNLEEYLNNTDPGKFVDYRLVVRIAAAANHDLEEESLGWFRSWRAYDLWRPNER